MRKKIFLVDGSGYIFRAFHALPPLSRYDGTPVGAAYGFTTMLLKLLQDLKPDYIAVIFDAGRKTFRQEMYPDYKANRKETPPDLITQFPIIREACTALSLPIVELVGYEADDLIATYVKQATASGIDVTIVSSDKDLMQLVTPTVVMWDPIKNKIIDEAGVVEKFGVMPDKVIEVQALAGDASDNIPGVPGIGVKTAAELIQTYGNVEQLLASAGAIKQPKRRQSLLDYADNARLSKKLVTLCNHAPITMALEDFKARPWDNVALENFLNAQNFKTLAARAARMVQQPTSDGAVASVVPDATPATYELVTTNDQLDHWIAKAYKAGCVAVDTETDSINAMSANLVGISLSTKTGDGCYIPLQHKNPPADLLNPECPVDQLPLMPTLEKLKPLLTDAHVLKVGQNLKFDQLVLRKYGASITPVDDTMLLSYVLGAGQHGHGMDELARRYFNYDTIKYSDVTRMGRHQVTFDYVPLDKALTYAAEDADITLRLYHTLKPLLVSERLVGVYEKLERPLMDVLVEMEAQGVKVDAAALQKLSIEFEKRLAVLADEIYALCGVTFNISSPKQLGEVLFDTLKLAGGKKSKLGAYSTSVDVLEDLAFGGHAVAKKLLEWRQLAKLKSTYTDALIGEINPATGRIHTSYAMAVTSTGRLASSHPNLQNIPIRSEEGLRIRKCFVAKEGHVLLSADYSQIELRLLAHMADIESLKEAFRSGQDIHKATAASVFNVPLASVDAAMRRSAKTINFGIIYGISAFGLAKQLDISNGEAAQLIKAYFAHYPGIQEYMERMKDEARQKGYVTTLMGRRAYTPGINDSNPTKRNGAERQAINAPLQGSNADIIKDVMIKLHRTLPQAFPHIKMLLQVHDELIFEVPNGDVEAAIPFIRTMMTDATKLSLPLVVDIGTGASWAEAH